MSTTVPAKLKLSGLQENVPLKAYSTFKIGGPARYFFAAKNAEEMVVALDAARAAQMPFFVLGGGSNVLIADRGFDGLVIHDLNVGSAVDGTSVHCGSGLSTMGLLTKAAEQGLGGMEFMAGIPGNVGSAIRGNAGAWGRAFGELLTDVELYREGKRVHVKPDTLGFAYRASILREQPHVVLGATLQLTKRDRAAIDAEVAKIVADRNARLPDEPSIGSIFKNIELEKISIDLPRVLKALDVTEEEFRAKAKYKLPVGFLTECLGLRGTAVGGVQLSEKHGNVIINPSGTAKAEDVVQLIALVKTRIRNSLGIQLQEEIQYVGF